MLTIEKAKEMSTRDLQEIVWDWYKDVHGIRPRHWSENDREPMLKFIENELLPETQELRKKQWLEDEKILSQMEEDYEKKIAKENSISEIEKKNKLKK